MFNCIREGIFGVVFGGFDIGTRVPSIIGNTVHVDGGIGGRNDCDQLKCSALFRSVFSEPLRYIGKQR